MNIFNSRWILVTMTSSMMMACANPLGHQAPINRVGPGGGTPVEKASQACATALNAVQPILKGDANVSDTALTPLPDGTCSVFVEVTTTAGGMEVAGAIKKVTKGLDSFIPVASGNTTQFVPLWYTVQKSALPGDPQLLLDDCYGVKVALEQKQIPLSTVSVVDSHIVPGLGPCYVRIGFATNSAFENYLKSSEDDLFLLHYKRPDTGVIVKVPIFALSTAQKPD